MNRHIGCSGYYYKEWKERFYPEDLPESKWLEFYAGHFNTVEINNTFYNMPSEKDIKKWKEQTPGEFRFTIKAHRFFTHMKKLKKDRRFSHRLSKFQDVLHLFDDQLGCILWQLPANLHKNLEKLEHFLGAVDPDLKHAVEFRHISWFCHEVYDLLSGSGVSFCMISAPDDLPEDVRTTSKTGYLRFHGKDTWYDYHYSNSELKDWKNRLDQIGPVDDLFIYFNNDQHGHAVDNAKSLKAYY